MAINAYVNNSSSAVSVHVANTSSSSRPTASVNPIQLVPTESNWEKINDKPFETVDEETLSTEGGVLRFRTGSYEDLSDLPSIEGVKLVDDKSFEDLGMEECSILSIEKMFN